jgi:CRP-like cAMP-binding protein
MIETDYIKEGSKLLKDVRKIPVLDVLSDADLSFFLKMSKVRKYQADEFVCKEGFLDNWVYFLLQGKVKVEKQGRELALLEERGEIFGEMGLIDGSPRSASVIALTTTVCLATDTHLLDDLTGSEKVTFGYILYRAFAGHLAIRLRKANNLVVATPDKFDWKKLKKKFF